MAVRPLQPLIRKLNRGCRYDRNDVIGFVNDAETDLFYGRLEDAVVRLELAELWFKATFPFTFGAVGVIEAHQQYLRLTKRIGEQEYRRLVSEVIPKVYEKAKA